MGLHRQLKVVQVQLLGVVEVCSFLLLVVVKEYLSLEQIWALV